MKRLFALLSLFLLLTACHSKSSQHRYLNLNITDDPVSFDPRQVRSIKDLTIARQLYEGLMRCDASGNPLPALATHVTVSEDHLTYTFHLRESVWSNGDPVTAHDFVYAWMEVLDRGFGADYASLLFPIKNARLAYQGKCDAASIGVLALDDLTLVVQLAAPTAYFLELVAFPTFFPVNHRLAIAGSKETVTNGPFQLTDWIPQDSLLLTRNPLYWDADHVYLEGIAFSMIPDANTEGQLFEKGLLDWLGQPLSSSITSEFATKMKEEKKLHSYPVAGTFWFRTQTQRAPFTDLKMRKAFAYALNREEIITHILQGNQAVATSPLPPSVSAAEAPYYADANLEEARRLFEEALCANGWTRETLPPVVLSYNTSVRNTKIAQLVQQQWERAFGIKIALKGEELQYFKRQIRSGNFVLATGEWVGDFNDPVSFLDLFREAKSHINTTCWEDKCYKKLMAQALYEGGQKERAALLGEAEKILVDQMPVIPVYHYSFDYIKNDQVKDVVLSPLGGADFKSARLR